MKAKVMKLYVHERRKDDSRRLFGADEVKRTDSEDDTDDLVVTLTSYSKAYLAGGPGFRPSNRSASEKDKRRLRVVHHDLRAEVNDMLAADLGKFNFIHSDISEE